ncbi:MAG: S8 family peptidase [Gammaproteobacteria bacterium]
MQGIKLTCPAALVSIAAMGLAAFSTSAAVPDDATKAYQHTNQIIVKFKDQAVSNSALGRSVAGDKSSRAAAVGASTGLSTDYQRSVFNGADVFKLGKWHSLEALNKMLAQMATDPNIEYAEPDQLMQPLLTPNDSRYNEQWHYFENTGGMRLPTAWNSSTGSGVVVAVIDTGYRPHADLNANLLPGYDMIANTFTARDGNGRDSDARDPGDWTLAGDCGPGEPARGSSWHGTHVAGTVAARTNNNSGVAGVAFGAKVVPIRALGRCGGFTSDIADGIRWAAGGSVSGVPNNANPAKVLNLSLGGGGACSSTSQSAINSARSNGAVVVVAAGNSAVNASNANPANCSGVVTVASTNRSGGRSYFSNFGAVVDVAAPGGDIRSSASNGVLSTLNTGSSTPGSDNYAFYQGTSMAAPHVAGVAALMLAVDGTLTPNEIESTLKSTARSFPASCSQCGSGLVDAAAAVAAVSGSNPPGGGNTLQNGVAKTGLSASTNGELRYTLSVPAGASDLSFAISGGSGDADLYVRFGSAPTTSTYNCRPYLNGNNETCNISNVQAGTYHVMVRAYSTFSNVSLVGSFTTGGGGPTGGTFSRTNQSASTNNWNRYTVSVPSGMSSLVVQIAGGSGDADLYLRRGSAPTTSSYSCRPYLNGNSETCTVNNPQSGTWHIGVRAYRTYSGVNVNAEWNP